MKTLSTIIILAMLLTACEKQACYQLDTYQTTYCVPADSGFPHSIHVSSIQCDIDEDEAAEMCKELTSIIHSTRDSFALTIVQTTTYQKK
jgi:hypothetical protein